jgi:methylated-DNA-[protein]-cysteine S-methyltransferase
MSELERELTRTLSAGGAGATADDLETRLVARAAEEGLLDVAYATVDTPLGTSVVAATQRGLVRLGLPNEAPENVILELAEEISPRVLEAPARLDEARRELEDYFEGRRHGFDLKLDWRLSRAGFYRRVLRATAKVPFGSTTTYAQVAARAGSPRAHRAAGSALGSNPIPIVVPCHRVLQTGGAIGNYGGGPEMKRFLLELEGAISG